MNDTDESYDPHARMHDSFPRVDSGTKMAGDVVSMPMQRYQGAKATLGQTINEINADRGLPQMGSNVIPIRRPLSGGSREKE